MIYTTYFAKINQLPKNAIIIAISFNVPSFYKGLRYTKLAPTNEILSSWKQLNNNINYVKAYNSKILNNLNAKEVINEIYNLAGFNKYYKDIDIYLLCYEKSDAFCHRHLVSCWLNNNGFKCEEWFNEELSYQYEPPIYDWTYIISCINNIKIETDSLISAFEIFDDNRLIAENIIRYRIDENIEYCEYYDFNEKKFIKKEENGVD